MNSRIEKLAVEYPNILFAKVDINTVAEIPRRQEIHNIPTIQIFQDGKLSKEIKPSEGVRQSNTSLYHRFFSLNHASDCSDLSDFTFF